MKAAILSPLVAGALREAMHERLACHSYTGLCDWCLRPFDVMKPRYLSGDLSYCSLGCRQLDEEVV